MAEAQVAVPPAGIEPTGLARLLAVLDADRGGARYIGGWVRDRLLGLDPADLDIATRLPPQEAAARAQAAGLQVWTSPSGLAHGTVGVVIGGRSIEVTTLRRDVATDGRHAVVAFTADWQEDAARRDFTINALSADPLTGEVFDYFNGLADLARPCVRFIGAPLTRIAEDHLRILRFFRFHARFGGAEPDGPSLAACTARAKDLMALSRERIAAELLKLLALPDPVATLRLMLAGGILLPVLPEIADAERLAALVAAERQAGVAPDGLRRLAALLPAVEDMARAVGARLRLSKAEQRRLLLDADRAVEGSAEALAYAIGAEAAVDRLLLAGRGDDAARLIGWERPPFPLTGGALIALGLKPGPAVAAALKRVEARWVAEGFPDPARAQALAREEVGV